MPYTQVTLSQLVQEVKNRWESQPFWTDAEAVVYLNQGLRFWNLLTGKWQKKELLLTPFPLSPYIDLPGSLTYGSRVTFGPGPCLEFASIPELDRLHPRWRGETTASGGAVPATPRRWAPLGLTRIALWPQDAIGGKQVLVDGCAATPILVNPGDFADMGSQDLNAITGMAVYLGSFKRGASAILAAKPLLNDFMQAALQQNDRLRFSAYFRKVLSLDKGRTGGAFQTLGLQSAAAASSQQQGGQ